MKIDIGRFFWSAIVIAFTINLLGFGLEISIQYKLINVILAMIGWEVSSYKVEDKK